MRKLELYETKTGRFTRKMREFKRKLIRDLAYFTLTGLIFYGLMNTTILPAIDGIYTSVKNRTMTITKVIIPSSNASSKQEQIISPLPLTVLQTPTPTPIPVSPDEEPMVEKIRKVFGEHTEKALLLLKGRPDICSENAKLNPNAVNSAGNTPQGSQDVGLFQINTYWNDIGNVSLLKDPDVNIAVAWYKYKASGYSFNLWTCGKALDI